MGNLKRVGYMLCRCGSSLRLCGPPGCRCASVNYYSITVSGYRAFGADPATVCPNPPLYFVAAGPAFYPICKWHAYNQQGWTATLTMDAGQSGASLIIQHRYSNCEFTGGITPFNCAGVNIIKERYSENTATIQPL